MAYQAYSTQKVFQDELLNIYSNRIFDAVHTKFPGSELQLVATGDLSRIIQGGVPVQLPVIQLVTNNTAIYSHLVRHLQEIITVQTQLSFQNRIQLVTASGYFEIWLDVAMLNTVNINNLHCLDLGGSYPAPVSPYNIELAQTQAFSISAQNDLFFKGWEANISTPVKMVHILGGTAPVSVAIDVQIENVFLTQPAGKYTGFKFQTSIVNWKSQHSQYHMGHIQLLGDVAYLYPGLELLENSLQKAITTNAVNLNLLEPGERSWDLLIEVHGVRSDSGLIDRGITSLRLAFELDIITATQVVASLDEIHLPHIRNEAPLPGQQFEVFTGTNFSMSLPDFFEVTGGNIVETTPTYGRKRYTGSGQQTLTVAATPSFDAFDGQRFQGYLSITTGEGDGRSSRGKTNITLPLTGYMFTSAGILVEPESLQFFAIKGLEPPATQKVQVIATHAFSVTHPFWLQVFPLAGGYFQRLTVNPINANNLISGEYFDNIYLTSNAVQVELPVQLRVVESIDEAFSIDEINFTHDNEKFTHLYSANQAERASCSLEIKSYNFKGFPETGQFDFKGTFFNNSFRIHLGEIIARKFAQLAAPSVLGFKHYNLETEVPHLFKIFKYYRPSAVTLSLNIEERATGVVVENEDFENINFVSGRTPKKFKNDFGILNFESVAVRVTQKSQVLFNFMRRYSQHEIKIFRNNNIYKTITHTPGNDALFGLAMIFKDFAPGDVIDVRLAIDEETYHVQQYVVFPPQPQSQHIAFINEYNLLEVYEFTGAYEILSETKVITARLYKNLVEHINNIETSKEQRLRINTGWVLKSNQVIIDAIANAQLVWLVQNGREISLSPVAMKLSNEDSARELYQYDVEFIINRTNELEVYSL